MKCAVLGDPVAHSLSPVLHRAGYAALGLGWSYDAHQVPAGGLARFVDGLDDQWRGLSVTAPLKREALELGDRVTDRARLVGAANTLVLGGPEGTLADNTDLPGAVAALRERYAGPVTAATIVGAGATAASTGLAMCELGASRVTLLARSPARAAATVEAIGRHPSAPEVEVAPLDTAPGGEVLVSTVPATAQEPDLVARWATAPVVFEVVYEGWPTPLAAATRGILVGGLDLLVHQAVTQFELFTGERAPLEAMRVAGERVLAARASRTG